MTTLEMNSASQHNLFVQASENQLRTLAHFKSCCLIYKLVETISIHFDIVAHSLMNINRFHLLTAQETNN